MFLDCGDRGGEGESLGDVRVVLRRVISVGDDLERRKRVSRSDETEV